MKKLLLVVLFAHSLGIAMDPLGDSSGSSRADSRDEQELRLRKNLSRPASPVMTRLNSNQRPPSPVVMLSEAHDSTQISCDSVACLAVGCCCTCGLFPLIKLIAYCSHLKKKL